MATTKLAKAGAKGALPANTGLTESQRQQMVDILNKRLSDEMVLYTKTRNYHWNVTGMEFIQLHELFEKQYDELAESIDEIAEYIRQVGGFAFGTLDEFKQNSSIEEQPGHIPNAEDMIRNLLHDHELCIQQLRKDADTAEEVGDMLTNDFLIGKAHGHEKMAWFLRAHIEHATR